MKWNGEDADSGIGAGACKSNLFPEFFSNPSPNLIRSLKNLRTPIPTQGSSNQVELPSLSSQENIKNNNQQKTNTVYKLNLDM